MKILGPFIKKSKKLAYGGPLLKTPKLVIETSSWHSLNWLVELVSKFSKHLGSIHKIHKKVWNCSLWMPLHDIFKNNTNDISLFLNPNHITGYQKIFTWVRYHHFCLIFDGFFFSNAKFSKKIVYYPLIFFLNLILNTKKGIYIKTRPS